MISALEQPFPEAEPVVIRGLLIFKNDQPTYS
jgi:hypothetical protein